MLNGRSNESQEDSSYEASYFLDDIERRATTTNIGSGSKNQISTACRNIHLVLETKLSGPVYPPSNSSTSCTLIAVLFLPFIMVQLLSTFLPFFMVLSSLCSFPCPWYQKVPLSLALSPRIISEVANFKPDIIHASSPGIMVIVT